MRFTLFIPAALIGCGPAVPAEKPCDPPTGHYELFAHRTYASARRQACTASLTGSVDLTSAGMARVQLDQRAIDRECAVRGVLEESPEGQRCAPVLDCACPEGTSGPGCMDLLLFAAPSSEGPQELLSGELHLGDSSPCTGSYRAALWRIGEPQP